MSSQSSCQVSSSWVEVGSFHKRLMMRLMIFTASVRNILDIPSYSELAVHFRELSMQRGCCEREAECTNSVQRARGMLWRQPEDIRWSYHATSVVVRCLLDQTFREPILHTPVHRKDGQRVKVGRFRY
jgi:hypothetical protein